MGRWLSFGAVALTGARLAAQAPPGTDIYLTRLSMRSGKLGLNKIRNVTDRPGYDNQPSFSPDGKTLYFSSVRDGQSDIYRLAVGAGEITRVTDTPESEYSPVVMPGGKDIAVIRVERDSTQRLWAFPIAGGAPRLLLERVKPVGYQAWLDPGTVGLFVLGSPATLQVADLTTGTARILLSSIGRSLHRVPGRRALSVTRLVAEDTWWVVEVDPATAAARSIARMPAGAEYFIWLRDGSLLSAAGRTLFRLRPGKDTTWAPAATLPAGTGSVTRMATSPAGDWLALVIGES